MLTEEKLPAVLNKIDCDKGLAKVTYKTAVKRDDEVLHVIYEYHTVSLDKAQDLLEQVRVFSDAAVVDKIASEKLAAAQQENEGV